MRRTTWLLVASVGLASGLQAQKQIPVGARVKIVLSERERQRETRFMRRLVIRGELTAMSAESLWVRPTPVTGIVAVPTARIRRLYESRGVPSRVASLVTDGVGGAVLGAATFAIWYGRTVNGNRVDYGEASRGDAARRGATTGFTVFGIIGFVLPVERWRHRSLDDR
jgi:hypothetical protein